MRLPLQALVLLLMLCAVDAREVEPFFEKGDVIAFVGGEDMVAAGEHGHLEFLLTRALPDHRLRFRNLAWEGDTVFEQRRDLNFPTWEEQFDKVGATVVIAQFGQMESLAGKEKLPEFVAAYDALLERFRGGGKRRVFVVGPVPIGVRIEPDAYAREIGSLALRKKMRTFGLIWASMRGPMVWTFRDGVHLDEPSHRTLASHLGVRLAPEVAEINKEAQQAKWAALSWIVSPGEPRFYGGPPLPSANRLADIRRLHELINDKNRLWFDYWRPQNWAFLAGDRTVQPSSRDHVDPSKRWFPPEREQFLPLIEAKEAEIAALAAKLAQR